MKGGCLCNSLLFVTVSITALLPNSVLSQSPGQSFDCTKVENRETKKFTYHICHNTNLRNFTKCNEFCKSQFGTQSHLVTFPNQQEYDFLIKQLNKSTGDQLRFYPGFYQQSKDSKFHPETGKFYWINDENQITNESESYWLPFSRWIVGFDDLFLRMQQYQYYTMDKDGEVYPAVIFTKELEDTNDPVVICMSPGVTEEPEPPLAGTDTVTASIDTWIIIVIVASAVIIITLIVITISCCISKRKQRFEKVPVKEPQPSPPAHDNREQV